MDLLERWARLMFLSDFKPFPAMVEHLVVWMSNNLEEATSLKMLFVKQPGLVASLPADMNVLLPVPSMAAVNHLFLDWGKTRIAEHLTTIEADLYNRVQPQEFSDLAWQRDDKELLAPHLARLAERFNSVAFWVAATIVYEPEPPRTTQHVIIKWLNVAWKLLKLGNFQTLFAVVSGLNHGASQRMKQIWASLSQKYHDRFSALDALSSPLSGYKNYREALASKVSYEKKWEKKKLLFLSFFF